jgi:hypothetical protein
MINIHKYIESFTLESTIDFRIVIKCAAVGLVVINPLYTWGKIVKGYIVYIGGEVLNQNIYIIILIMK